MGLRLKRSRRAFSFWPLHDSPRLLQPDVKERGGVTFFKSEFYGSSLDYKDRNKGTGSTTMWRYLGNVLRLTTQTWKLKYSQRGSAGVSQASRLVLVAGVGWKNFQGTNASTMRGWFKLNFTPIYAPPSMTPAEFWRIIWDLFACFGILMIPFAMLILIQEYHGVVGSRAYEWRRLREERKKKI